MLKPKPPTHLGKHGAKLFREVAAEFAIDDPAGLALLTTAAECLDRIRAAQASMGDDGPICKDRYGAPKLHPALQLEKDARNGLLAALKQLQLDIEPLRDRTGRPAGAIGG